ncbi:MAG: hypothetical protein QM765_29810 [Myxococcales bacterium]
MDGSGHVYGLYSGKCGLIDGSDSGWWLVPWLDELGTLVAPPDSYRAVSLNAAGFSGVLNGGYWSADEDPFDAAKHIVIHFQDGNQYSVPATSVMSTLPLGSQLFHFLDAPQGVDLGNVAVNTTSGSRTVALRDLGGGYMDYLSSGTTAGLPVTDLSLVGGDSALFSLDKGDGGAYRVTGVGACGPTPSLFHSIYSPATVSLPGPPPCTVGVAFRPTSPGPKWTILRVTSAGKNPVRDILLTGNTLVSSWKAEDDATDSVGSNHGTLQVTATAPENGTANASCPAGGVISSYTSTFGAQGTWTACGTCTLGAASCSVAYSTAACTDPLPGVAKSGQLSLGCTGGYAVGRLGQAFSFDGSRAQSVAVPHSATLDLGTRSSVMFWIKLNALPPAGQFVFPVSKYVNGLEDKTVFVDSAGKVHLLLYGTTSGAVSNGALVPGQWTHVAATYDGVFQRIYFDGVLNGIAAATGDVADSTGKLYLGYNPERGPAGQSTFNGLLDEVRWYAFTLTDDQIQEAKVVAALTANTTGFGDGQEIPSAGNLSWSGTRGTADYGYGTDLTVSAIPDSASTFDGWQGDCPSPNNNTCKLTMNGDKWVAARFSPIVGVKGFELPVPGAAPQTAAALLPVSNRYLVTSLTWTPAHASFQSGVVYTAAVVLTSVDGYAFPKDPTTRANLGTPSKGVTSDPNPGNTVTFNVTFPGVQGLVSWWKGEADATDTLGVNHGTPLVRTIVAEGETATAQCRSGSTVASYSSLYGAGLTWTSCGTCMVGVSGCTVVYNSSCLDPAVGVPKIGVLTLECAPAGSYGFGRIGKAFSFDGSRLSVAVDDSSTLDVSTAHTLGFWVKLTALPAAGKVFYPVSKWENGKESKGFSIDSSGKVTYFLYGASAQVESLQSLVPARWTHLAGTYDGANLKLYFDGVLDAAQAATGDVADGKGTLYLGFNPEREREGNEAPFKGLLDEVQWNNGALSAADVAMMKGVETLTITLAGGGQGTVSADVGTIQWVGKVGTVEYPAGTSVLLTAQAGASSTLRGWSGDCSGTGDCRLLMNGDKAVTATFDQSVAVSGFTYPVTGQSPVTAAGLVMGEPSLYSATSLTWSPADDPFLSGTAYTATVVLTSRNAFAFPAEGQTPQVSSAGTPSPGTTTGTGVGNTLTFTVTFPATCDAGYVAAPAPICQPCKDTAHCGASCEACSSEGTLSTSCSANTAAAEFACTPVCDQGYSDADFDGRNGCEACAAGYFSDPGPLRCMLCIVDAHCGNGCFDCTTPEECRMAGTCDALPGHCVRQDKVDGTPCSGGVCASGVCVVTADAGTPGPDAATPGADAATPAQDSGTLAQDAALPGSDAAAPTQDSGTTEQDSGTAEQDAAIPGADAAIAVQDAAVLGTDAAVAAQDAATVNPDASAAAQDAGTDAGQAPAESSGCGCTAGSSGPVSGVPLLLALVFLRRRARGG